MQGDLAYQYKSFILSAEFGWKIEEKITIAYLHFPFEKSEPRPPH